MTNKVPHLRWLCRIAGWASTVGIFVLSVVPGEARPHSGVASPYVEHILAYLLATGLLTLGYALRTFRLLLCALLIGFAAALETVQLWVPGRNAELMGFAASALGVFFGWAGVAVLEIVLTARGKLMPGGG